MPSYKAPLDDMRFVLNEVLNVEQLKSLPGFEALDTGTVNQFLDETARLAENVLHPLNATGDHEGCIHDREAKTVTTPPGFKAAYKQFCEAGMTSFACDPAYGGLGMPVVLNSALAEMLSSANMAFTMYPGLSHGAYNALHTYGTPELKDTYLPKLVSGEWSGTMCLTEPQCGTDLGLIKTKAKKQADGSYHVTGTKIFISSGEHDLTSNILHLVLAKIDDPATPAGIKGISLFLVPKFLPDAQGLPGQRNPVFCGRIEEKMGIHANSTCEMNFEGAQGWLVGEAHKGMRAMFVMMNEARLGVGLQGLALSEIAYQNGLAYALDRLQGQPIEQKPSDENLGKSAVPIITHADVRRELLTIRAQAEAGRMLAYWVSMQLDIYQKHPDQNVRARAKGLVDLLIPVMKAHFTDNAVDHTNGAMQVFGGHGYIKEHGVEQFNRDARITRLYEGTNGVQALDLVGRKVLKDGLVPAYLDEIWHDLGAARSAGVPLRLRWRLLYNAYGRVWKHTFKLRVCAGISAFAGRAGNHKMMSRTMLKAGAMATDYLKLLAYVAMGHMWLKMETVARLRLKEKPEGAGFYETKIKTARFYSDRLLPLARAHSRAIGSGPGSTMSMQPAEFAHGQTTIGSRAWAGATGVPAVPAPAAKTTIK